MECHGTLCQISVHRKGEYLSTMDGENDLDDPALQCQVQFRLLVLGLDWTRFGTWELE